VNLLQLVQELIDEARQVGILYHYTTPENYRKIMEGDRLEGARDMVYTSASRTPRRQTGHLMGSKSISFTRNKNLHKVVKFSNLGFAKDMGRPNVRIAIDGDKLSQKYKLVPFRFFHDEPRIAQKNNTDEYETRVIANAIHHVSDYILKVDDIWKEIPTWANKEPFYVDTEGRAFSVETGEEIDYDDRYSTRWIEILSPNK